jgi:transposase-like protein
MITSLNLINMVYENYWTAVKRLQIPFDKHANWRKQAKTIGLSRQAQNRLEWIIFNENKGNVSLTCRRFGIPAKTFYKWKNRFDDKNLKLLEDKSKAPNNKRKKVITSEQEMRIVALRKKYIRWGKIKLAILYQKEYQEKISSWKIQYTIQKYKLYYHPLKNEKLQKKRKRNQTKKRITELKKQPFPGYLIALDTIVIYWNLKRRIHRSW